MANWNWRVVREFVALWFGQPEPQQFSEHRLGFAFKRPKTSLKADEAKREIRGGVRP